jgi:predicted metal-dependent phosphoesterase TrpH
MPLRRLSIGVLVAGLTAGTLADRPAPRPPVWLGGYRVLAVDLHVHSSMWSDGALTPWGLVLEARRQGLDAIAVTAHNEVFDAKVARWFASLTGGPIVLVGEEIVAADHHLVAVGVDRSVDWRAPVAAEIDDVHRQGGVAIAAHPIRPFWPAFDNAAMARLDGSEVCQPVAFGREDFQRQLDRFAARRPLAAIGSSDFHGWGRMGLCRTYVFARDASAPAILDALRDHRTVVYGLNGRAYGDPALIRLAATAPELREAAAADSPAARLDRLSRVAGTAGLAGMLLFGARRRTDGPGRPRRRAAAV